MKVAASAEVTAHIQEREKWNSKNTHACSDFRFSVCVRVKSVNFTELFVEFIAVCLE